MVPRLNIRDDGKHEIQIDLFGWPPLRTGSVSQLRQNAVHKIAITGSERVHHEQFSDHHVGMVDRNRLVLDFQSWRRIGHHSGHSLVGGVPFFRL
jgi:hypothetical protein